MEKYADLKRDFINLRQVLESHFRSFFELPEHRGIMMIGMIKSPILTEILYNNIPPFSTDKMINLFLSACNRIYSFDHFHPDILILCELLNSKTVLSQNMCSNLS